MTGKPSTLRVAPSLGCRHDFDLREGHAFPGFGHSGGSRVPWIQSDWYGGRCMVAAARTGCSGTGRSVIVQLCILAERTPSAGQFAGSAGRGWRGYQSSATRLRTPLFPLSCGVALRLSPGLLPAPAGRARGVVGVPHHVPMNADRWTPSAILSSFWCTEVY